MSVILIFLNAYPWPMKNGSGNFNGPLTVYATLGDARGDLRTLKVHRFHHGIDIVASNGTPVYSIVTGTANIQRWDQKEGKWVDSEGPNAFVQVGHYWYIHVKGDDTRTQNSIVGSGLL